MNYLARPIASGLAVHHNERRLSSSCLGCHAGDAVIVDYKDSPLFRPPMCHRDRYSALRGVAVWRLDVQMSRRRWVYVELLEIYLSCNSMWMDFNARAFRADAGWGQPGIAEQGVQPLLLTTNSFGSVCSRPRHHRRLPPSDASNMSKKSAKTQNKDQSYEFRDVVLAKVRGFPPWPGMVMDPDNVPEEVAKERPNAKTKKGNWYCVRFFPAGDYAWIVPKDISRLQQHEIQAYINEPFKRSGDLLKGYRIALDPTSWEEERDAALAEAAEEEANAEIDQLESDGEEEADHEDEKKTKAKKRKRESDVAPPKVKSKAKPKKDSAEPASKKRSGSATKGKKNGPKSKTMVESEDEGGAEPEDEDAGPSKHVSPPPAKKAKRDKDEDEGDAANNDPEAVKVREWRHKLQKAFLNNKAVPKEEDMPALDALFSTVESFDKMTFII
ncbi:PWWP domain-containing protein2 [Grifola frondosa]|uniref:PWWP domain-containing protein2 n=1 Tax=Grifola frondosa TaxID=5627 RepID=A0A1C7M197_GRIFR|nr:PWWP domain-containing protein2 [Grifola frondosa]